METRRGLAVLHDNEQAAAAELCRERASHLIVATTGGEPDVREARSRRRNVEPSGQALACRIKQDVGSLAQHLAMLPFENLRFYLRIFGGIAIDTRQVFGGVVPQRCVDAARYPMIGDAEADRTDGDHREGEG